MEPTELAIPDREESDEKISAALLIMQHWTEEGFDPEVVKPEEVKTISFALKWLEIKDMIREGEGDQTVYQVAYAYVYEMPMDRLYEMHTWFFPPQLEFEDRQQEKSITFTIVDDSSEKSIDGIEYKNFDSFAQVVNALAQVLASRDDTIQIIEQDLRSVFDRMMAGVETALRKFILRI